MNYQHTRVPRADCQRHGAQSGAELFIVEGESAAKTVSATRDHGVQAVIPMQGKPINAMKARRPAVVNYPLFVELFQALGYRTGQPIDPTERRFERILLLFDPDADGIHCGALMLMFFYRTLRPLLEANCIGLVRAPLHQIRWQDAGRQTVWYANSDEHLRQLLREIPANAEVQRTRYRGLGSMNEDTIRQTCLDPATRSLHRVQVEDAEAAIAMFGGKQ